MPAEAYKNQKDKSNHVPTRAIDCTADDLNHVFLCLDPNCNARLSLCAINSNKRLPYFSNRDPKFRHSESCEYCDSNPSYLFQFDHEMFNPEDFLGTIIFSNQNKDKTNTSIDNNHRNGKENHELKQIRTVRQLYSLCLSNSLDDTIGNTKIINLLCNDATSFYYTKVINGIKLCVCRWHHYKRESKSIFLNYPYNQHNNSRKFFIELSFDNFDLFQMMNNKLYGYDGKILVFGNFEMIGGLQSKIKISSLKQLIPIK